MRSRRRRSVGLIILSQVLAMSLWFSATAVLPSLLSDHQLSPFLISAFTSAVQIGFVVGTLVSALLVLPDRVDPRRLFAICAVIAALANALILAVDITSPSVVLLRFATGVCMAGIYPVGMKLVSGWADGDMGLMIGLLVAALTLGSASPHLLGGLGAGLDWRLTLSVASGLAIFAAITISRVELGPRHPPSPPFDPRLMLKAWSDPALRLANLGYLGHMWELYAMWAWIGLYLNASFALSWTADPSTQRIAALATFAVIAAGAVGSILAGLAADRFGRTTVTMTALAISGVCCLLAGLAFGAAPAVVMVLCLIWGAAVVADSAQFSASIAELSDRRIVGTMLTVQTCMGFLLTLVTIHLIGAVRDQFGWSWVFLLLAPGPFLGMLAMARLRMRSEAQQLAGGRR